MSLASISIISAALILFGIFYLILVNINYNLDVLSEQPQMQVFCLPELTEEQVNAVQTEISTNEYIESFTVVSKKEAFEQLKKYLENEKSDKAGANILEGYDESFLNVSFIIKVKDPVNSETVAKELEALAGVENVRYSQQTIDLITQIGNWVKVISIVLIGILLIISLFIISNTIKLTVFARRKEINIMKYIGATDWFIRWPFVFEGILMGIIGATVAFILVAYLYSFVSAEFGNSVIELGQDFHILDFKSTSGTLSLFYIGVSTVIGAAGSAMSMRKHLHV
jgi:cell division transport system permease protein